MSDRRLAGTFVMPELIIVVDVENATDELLRRQSHEDSLIVLSAPDGPKCLRLLFEERPHLVVMDLSNGHLDGVELCRLIRQMCDTPILCLIQPDHPETLIDCLEAGADECVTRPIGGLELIARVLALLRRVGASSTPSGRRACVGDILIDIDAYRVTKRGVPVTLAPREFKLLSALAERPGCVVSHEQLLSRVWGAEFGDDIHYLRLYVRYLRQKLEDEPSKPRYILTERGIGYRLGPDPMSARPWAGSDHLTGYQLERVADGATTDVQA